MKGEPTPMQAARMLSALTNLQLHNGTRYKWEAEALVRLRWHLLNLISLGEKA
jgi:hypothetical protein